MMMQLTETHKQKNSLFNAMNRFIGAVNNMDQTVMVPSLLRDVPLDEESEMMSCMRSDEDEGDMYSYYQLLKSIRRDMEWGVRRATADELRKENMTLTRMNSTASSSSSSSSSSTSSASSSSSFDEDDEEYGDLEKLFKYHLTGLQDVLSKLTQQAISLTKRYKQEIGIGGWGQ